MNRTILRVTWRPARKKWAVMRGRTIGYMDNSRERAEAFAREFARDLRVGLIRIETVTGEVEREISF